MQNALRIEVDDTSFKPKVIKLPYWWEWRCSNSCQPKHSCQRWCQHEKHRGRIPSPVKRFTTIAIGESGKGSKRRRGLATNNPGANSTDLDQMLMIVIFSASHHMMEFLGGTMGLSVRWVGGITQADQWEGSTIVMEKPDHVDTR